MNGALRPQRCLGTREVPEAKKWLRPLRAKFEDVAAIRELWGIIAYHDQEWELARRASDRFRPTGSPIHHAAYAWISLVPGGLPAVDRLLARARYRQHEPT